MKRRDVMCGFLGGLILCCLLVISNFLAVSQHMNLLPILIIFGGAIVAASLLYKNSSLGHGLLRTFLMYFVCFIALYIFAITGMIRWVADMLNVNYWDITESKDRAIGLFMSFLLAPILIETCVINVVFLVISIIKTLNTPWEG